MGATIDGIRALQDIELQIVDIRRQLANKERLVTRQLAQHKAVEDAIAGDRNEVRKAQMAVDEIDLDLKARNAHVAKIREALNSVKSNKEYATLLGQLNTEKADATRVEQRAFELMAVVEEKKNAMATKEASLKLEQTRLDNVRGQFEQARKLFADKLAVLEKQRSQLAAALTKEALELFNRVSERYEGEVMARISRVNPRRDDYLCDGCNMSLAAERFNALMTRDTVITCDNCGRILYVER